MKKDKATSGAWSTDQTETYVPVPAAGGTILDWVRSTRTTTAAGGYPASSEVEYTHDVMNRLRTIKRGSTVETLQYGPSGELMSKQIGTSWTFWVGEYATVTATIPSGCGSSPCTAQNVGVDAHVIFAGTRIASAGVPAGTTTARTLYYYRSRLGTVVGTSQRGGTLGAVYRYTPYGAVAYASEIPANRSELGYTNALRLSGNLLHLKTRAYDPEARIFLQIDSVDRQRYAYVGGDPINLSDSWGMEPEQPKPPCPGGVDTCLVYVWTRDDDDEESDEDEYTPEMGDFVWNHNPGDVPAEKALSMEVQYFLGVRSSGYYRFDESIRLGARPWVAVDVGRSSGLAAESRWLDWKEWDLSGAANFFAGFGSALTFGMTDRINNALGNSEMVDSESAWYLGGQVGGIALSTAFGGALGARAAVANAGRRGFEFSHWIPGRVLRSLGFEGRSVFNGNWVSIAEHAINDPFRHQLMPRVWRAMNPLNPSLLRQLNRLPYLLRGAGAGAAYGSVSAAF